MMGGQNGPNQLQRKVLEQLLDAYEKSKTFQGGCQVNESMEELCASALVAVERERNGVLKKVVLNMEKLDDCYAYLGRTPRRQEQEMLLAVWEELSEKLFVEHVGEQSGKGGNAGDELFEPLRRYITAQYLRIEKNQNVEYYSHNLEEYWALLEAAEAVLENREEIFIRNFSIKVFHDSKRMEQLAGKLAQLLYQYGEFQEKDAVLEECGIVHTPTYVMLKGNVRLMLGGQKIDLSLLQGDIALSTESLKGLQDVAVLGARVVTVENLTSFHDYPAGKDCMIYLGGFHNQVKRDFLLYLYERNREKEYCHFGDIDAGGFYILEHLKRKTGIGFRTLYMDVETLRLYQGDAKPLTENDRKRLIQLKAELDGGRSQKDGAADYGAANDRIEDYGAVIDYMLEHNCKLEQEVVWCETVPGQAPWEIE